MLGCRLFDKKYDLQPNNQRKVELNEIIRNVVEIMKSLQRQTKKLIKNPTILSLHVYKTKS